MASLYSLARDLYRIWGETIASRNSVSSDTYDTKIRRNWSKNGRRYYRYSLWWVNIDSHASKVRMKKISGYPRFRKWESKIYLIQFLMLSLFSRIISWEIPSYKIYEDEYIYAFLDIFPQRLGHTLIVPKCEGDHFSDVPEPYYSAIFQTAKKLSPAIQKATGCQRICASFIGYEVPHCHYHLIPTDTLEQANFHSQPRASSQDLEKMQKTLLSFL